MAKLDFELGQDGVAEGFGRDAGAVGNKENSAVGHGGKVVKGGSDGRHAAAAHWAARGLTPYNDAN